MGLSKLYNETITVFQMHGYNDPENEVAFVSDGTHFCSWADFIKQIRDTVYDNGYGVVEINSNLVIKMCDGAWYERDEYDGSEWWAYRRAPQMPSCIGKVRIREQDYDERHYNLNFS